MSNNMTTLDEYIANIPTERKEPFISLLQTIRDNIDPKFSETVLYGMPGWVISNDIYPAGYHVDPSLPVSFMAVANQKHYIALYHMGLYADPDLLKWFVEEYEKTGEKLDMGKSCVRFKKMDKIPHQLIAELASRMSLDKYLALYVTNIPSKK
jgi:uncharacterized protein YdhG (YjbR/CyaY superfamily)